jgi:hypothetical protein
MGEIAMSDSRRFAFVCSGSVYEFEGVQFELGYPIGPWPVHENSEPYEADDEGFPEGLGAEFFELYERFDKLSEEEKEEHCIVRGGCRPLVIGGSNE